MATEPAQVQASAEDPAENPTEKQSTQDPRTQKAYDLIAGRCHWTGDWCKDYMYHIANWHPLFSCACCDPANPYNRLERIAVLLVMSTLSMIPSMFINFVFEASKNTRNYIGTKILTLLCVTLPIMIVQYTIEYLIWFQMAFELHTHRQRIGLIFTCFSCGTKCMKNCCLSISVYFSVLFVLLALWIATMMHADYTAALKPFLISRLECWVLWFLTDMYNPCIGFYFYWRKEQRYEQQQKELEARRAAGEVMGFARVVQDGTAFVDGVKGRTSGLCEGLKANLQSCCRCIRDKCCGCCARSEEARIGQAARPDLRNMRTAMLPLDEDALVAPLLDEAPVQDAA